LFVCDAARNGGTEKEKKPVSKENPTLAMGQFSVAQSSTREVPEDGWGAGPIKECEKGRGWDPKEPRRTDNENQGCSMGGKLTNVAQRGRRMYGFQTK